MKTAARQEISSPQNPLLRALRRALREGEPGEDGAFGVEGPHLVEEALRSPVEVTALVAARSAETRLAELEARANGRLRSYIVPDRVFRSIALTETPQGMAALVRLPERRLEECLARPKALVTVLVGLQDPGNLGTILRSLEAFGGAACLLAENTVSPFNPKAARASAGSLFRVPVFRRLKLTEILRLCKQHGLRTAALAPHLGGKRGEASRRTGGHGFSRAESRRFSNLPQGLQPLRELGEVDLRAATALFIGREASGLPDDLLKQADAVVTIPLAAPVESLNAAMAATLALYEAARQRRG